ncbi:MAG: cytochrome P450 [Acidimicrobiales bacterium]
MPAAGDESTADELDPFEEFNKAMGAGIVTNPYPGFAAMRAEGVSQADVRQLLGLAPDADLGFDEGDAPPLYTVSSYDAVQEVLRDGERFSSAGYAEVMGGVMGHTILEMDEPEHHGYRSLIQQAFTRKAMERWEAELVGPVVDELIDGFVDRGRAELVSELFFPFPVNVIAGLLGLPRADLASFHRWTVELISVSIDMDKALGASKKLEDYLMPFVQERRVDPGRDLISVLAQAEHDGQRLTDAEIIAFCRLLLPAGAETTYRSSSNLFCGLLTHPDQLERVKADRSLLTNAIEEGLRWEPPLLTIMRTVVRDTTVAGVELRAGTVLVINMGAANHDERRWVDADELDISRPQTGHTAFASGPHMCLGMHLARMETKVVLDRLLERLPDVRLDPEAEAPYITGMTFRAPPRLDVVFS